MGMSTQPKIAVVGASLTALTFTLSLLHHDESFKPKDIVLFEARPPADEPGGQWYTSGADSSENPTRPLLMTPNSLRLLDKLGIYDEIKDKGYSMSRTVYRDVGGKFIGAATFGGKQEYGYEALRIERMVLFPALLKAIERKGVRVEYNSSLRDITSEDSQGVTFTVRRRGSSSDIASLETVRANMLIGCDGLHSKVRAHVLGHPCEPKYHGMIMVPFKFDIDKVRFGDAFSYMKRDNELSLGLSTQKGAIMMVPADPSGTPSMSFRQFKYPEQSRQGWEDLNADKDKLVGMLKEDLDDWREESDFVVSVLDQAKPQDTLLWPVYSLPKLDRWFSEGGKVVIIGDAAHSLIPAAAQGANVAVEDSWTLARVLANTRFDSRRALLRNWHDTRNERIEKVQKLSLQLMNARLPPDEQAKLPQDQLFDLKSQADDLVWLFRGVE